MKSRRRILIIVVAILVVAVLVIVVLAVGKDKTSPQTTRTFNTTPRAGRVVMSNINDFGKWINTDGFDATEKTLYARVATYNAHPDPTYTSIIRTSTFKTIYDDYSEGATPVSVPTVTFIVDIPAAGQSYRVVQSGGKDYPYDILHILCVEKNEQKYSDFGCTDGDQ